MRKDATQQFRCLGEPMIPGRRSHGAGADDISAQAAAAALDRNGLGIGDQSGLGGGIGGVAIVGERIDRGDEDQRARAARGHRIDDRRRDMSGAAEVDCKLALPCGRIHVSERFGARVAGVADENVGSSRASQPSAYAV